ncbi:unnamed protein product [Orchesella dallaii]|uniref:Uncharacterized protein n=1 Tax=Orchesella dallaii TaxID=48710 RepID=A0ABP1RCI0_9HEXA
MLEASDTGAVPNGGGSDTGHAEDVTADSILKRDTSLSEADENDNKTNKRIKSSPPPEETETTTETMDSDSGIGSLPEGKPIQRLDVPSEELKFIRKQVLIEKLMSSGGAEEESMEVESESGQNGPLDDSNNIVLPKAKHAKKSKGESKPQQRKTFKIRSSLLDRVKSFLPEFRSANDELLRLPDPSKISLESESDRDEMDGRGPQPGTSGSSTGNKTFVEMNLALVEQSDSDSSTDEESYVNQRQIKGLPTVAKRSSTSPSKSTGEVPIIVGDLKGSEVKTDVEAAAEPKTESVKEEKKALITELN